VKRKYNIDGEFRAQLLANLAEPASLNTMMNDSKATNRLVHDRNAGRLGARCELIGSRPEISCSLPAWEPA
jgi:hypothetical protein